MNSSSKYFTMNKITKMRKKISAGLLPLLFLNFCLLSVAVFSQPGQGRGREDQMKALESRRIAFLTERMALTPEEARVFWPVYNQYNEQRDNLMREHYRGGDGQKQVSEMSRTEAAQFAEREVARLEESARLKREFHESLKKILSVEKIALLYEAERDFNRMIFRESRQQQREAPRGRR
jgi:hypothetical protein